MLARRQPGGACTPSRAAPGQVSKGSSIDLDHPHYFEIATPARTETSGRVAARTEAAQPLVVAVGRLMPSKAVERVIGAVARVRAAVPARRDDFFTEAGEIRAIHGHD